MVKTLKIFLLLAGIYLITFFFNYNFLTKEIKNYDLAAIDLLTTFENWNASGISTYYFTPILTWQNPGDKFIAYYKRLEDKRGNNYYTSYGVLSQWIIYGTLKAFHLNPSKLFIQIFAGVWHFLGGIFIYLNILLILKQKDKKINISALFGFIIYSFSSTIIYANTFHFFAETFVLPLLLISVYFLLKLKADNYTNRWYFILFLLFLSLSIFSEWLGVLYAFSCAICFYYQRKTISRAGNKIIWTALIAILSILLIVLQYSLINGIDHLQDTMSLRFLERTGYFGDKYSDQQISIFNPASYMLLVKQINSLLMPWGYILIIFSVSFLIKFKTKVFKNYRFIIFILSFPALLHYVIFFNANTLHLFYLTKFVPAIAVTSGILLLKYQKNLQNRLLKILLLVMVLIIGIIFSYINLNKVSPVYDDTKKLNEAAIVINKIAKTDESIFIKSNNEEPANTILYLSYITKRNIMPVRDDFQAKEHLDKIPNRKGILFEFEFNNDINTFYNIKRLY